MTMLPENKEAEAKVEDGDLQNSPENHEDKQSSQLPAEPDLTRNSESVKTSAEHNLIEKSDKADDTPLEKKTEKTPLEKPIDDTTLEMHTDDTPLEKPTDVTPLEKQTDDTPLEKPTDDTPLEKPTDDMPLEKQTDDTPLEMQTDDTPLEKRTDDTPLEMQLDDTPLEMQTDDTALEMQTDDTLLVEQTNVQVTVPMTQMETGFDQSGARDVKTGEENEAVASTLENKIGSVETDVKGPHPEDNHTKTPLKEEKTGGEYSTAIEGSNHSLTFEPFLDGDDSGTEEEQVAFVKKLEEFYRERSMDFKPPKFYGEALNCLKLWRAVTRLGGYDQVTACKLWRQVGESFNPPKTCTTISWSFRIFFEKALLEYEKHKIQTGELNYSMANLPGPTSVDNQAGGDQVSGSGRARRDAAARAMQGWHTQQLLGYEEVGDPIIMDKTSLMFLKRDKQSFGTLKKRKPSYLANSVKVAKTDPVSSHVDVMVVDAGAPADWVKINVLRTKQFFEVYVLVPGLLREEVQVQSDPAGRLIISGEPEQQDNPWGVTPFKKVITLPSRIDPYHTSAVVTLHGQLFVRAPIDESDA